MTIFETIDYWRRYTEWWFRYGPSHQHFAAIVCLFAVAALFVWFKRGPIVGWWNPPRVYARIGPYTFGESDFFRHWLVSGYTGSGKTVAIDRLMREVCLNVPEWGGAVLDEKGIAAESLKRLMHHFGRAQDLVVLRPDFDCPEKGADRSDANTWNPLLETAFPDTAIAAMICRASRTARRDPEVGGYFPTEVELQLSRMISALRLAQPECSVNAKIACEILTESSGKMLKELLGLLGSKEPNRARHLIEHFRQRFLSMPERQLGGVRGTIQTYLAPFCVDALAAVFCPDECDFRISQMDSSKVVCLSIPPVFSSERFFFSCLLKNFVFEHANQRFALAEEELNRSTPLIVWMDEAQLLVSGEGNSGDHAYASKLRQARLALVLSTQDPLLSLIPAIGRQLTDALTLNLGNRIIFQAASQAGAEWTADFLGKRLVPDRTRSRSSSGTSTTTRSLGQPKYWYEPHELRALKKFHCVVKHCEKGFNKRPILLKPITVDGRTPDWFRHA